MAVRPEVGVIAIERSGDGVSARIGQNIYPELFIGTETGRYELDGESVVCLSTSDSYFLQFCLTILY